MAIMCYLQLILEDRGITWAELSRRTGVSYKTLWRLSSPVFDDRDHLPSAGTLDAVCRTLNVGVDDLLAYAEDS